jgi:hypothetical protein|tara:strand:- start:595 stop:954 length:360 start_codon:yes stop_codon:yes gene_type:complete
MKRYRSIFMKKSNLMAIGVAACMLSACGSSEDVDFDAVAASMMTGSNPASEKDAKCLAKSLKKNSSDDQWNLIVKMVNGEFDDVSEITTENSVKLMGDVMEVLDISSTASAECGVPLDL